MYNFVVNFYKQVYSPAVITGVLFMQSSLAVIERVPPLIVTVPRSQSIPSDFIPEVVISVFPPLKVIIPTDFIPCPFSPYVFIVIAPPFMVMSGTTPSITKSVSGSYPATMP